MTYSGEPRSERALIGVTGATGHLGGRIARALSAAGHRQRLLVRDQSRAPGLPGATVGRADYAAPAAVQNFAGIETLLMVSGAETPDRVAQHLAFLDAAAAAGVRHIVYTSFAGASANATFTLARDHAATEDHLRGLGVGWTVLRDNLYADFVPALVGADGVIRGPAGDGRVALVAQDDIAAIAVAVLLDPAAHAGATYDLTGPEALSLSEVASVLSEVGGSPVRFEDETIPAAYASRAGFGAPDWQVEAWVSTYLAIAAGELAAVSDAVTTLIGRPATALAEVLRARPSA